MEDLTYRANYPTEVAARIESMGAMAVSIANRWMLGWPDRVKAMIDADCYLDLLETQVDQEKSILANEANLRHLARHEILQMYEITEAPPAVG
ncbi:MAG: hypothetical protein HYS18_02115 [Burkholderiales bacterium]|nr:hypothetical protein [Burkholderiales bacterium]